MGISDNKGEKLTEIESEVQECNHQWLIDSPNGPTSEGVCLACGKKSQFKNSMPISGWDRSGSQARKAKQAQE